MNDPKKFWRDMDKLLNSKKNKSSKIGQLRHLISGELIDPLQTHDELNTFFCTVAEKLHCVIPQSTNPNTKPLIDDSLDIGEVTVDMFLEAINDMSPCKGSGCERISSKIDIDSFRVLVYQ